MWRLNFEDEPLADRQVATIASPVHGSVAHIVRLGDVSGRAHLEQPLADRQVAFLASLVHRSVAEIVRRGDVCGRAHLEQPLADQQVATSARHSYKRIERCQ